MPVLSVLFTILLEMTPPHLFRTFIHPFLIVFVRIQQSFPFLHFRLALSFLLIRTQRVGQTEALLEILYSAGSV